jgi:outer membrane protein TolC
MFGIASLAFALLTSTAEAEPTADQRAELEAELAREARLALIERVALTHHPALAEAKARSSAMAARASGAARFPDPELKYELWAVPLTRPYALNRADTHMFGVRQSFPAPGLRAARERVAGEDAQIATEQGKTLARDLTLRVRRAYFDYYAADRVLRVHLEHANVAEQLVAQVRADYEVGRGSQQDLLKVLVELARLHNDVAEVRQQRETSRGLLNALMARKPDAALGPPAELERPQSTLSSAELERSRQHNRPELVAAERTIRRAEAALAAAKISAKRPSFMAGVDYWLMPTQDMPHAYGGMVAMSLPWLSSGHKADVREAEQLLAAERYAKEAAESVTAFELHDAVARLEAANASLSVIEDSLLPQAEKSLASSQGAFSVGKADLISLLDTLRSYFQIRLEHSRALARVMAQLAQVEFASGARGARSHGPEATEKQP